MCNSLVQVLRQDGKLGEGIEHHRRAVAVLLSAISREHTSSVWLMDSREDRPFLKRAALRDLVDVLSQTGMDGHLEEAEARFKGLREGGDNSADCLLWNHCSEESLHTSRGNSDAAAKVVPGRCGYRGKVPRRDRASMFDSCAHDGPRRSEIGWSGGRRAVAVGYPCDGGASNGSGGLGRGAALGEPAGGTS